MLELLHDLYPEVYRFAVSVYPSVDNDVITSPYNSILGQCGREGGEGRKEACYVFYDIASSTVYVSECLHVLSVNESLESADRPCPLRAAHRQPRPPG